MSDDTMTYETAYLASLFALEIDSVEIGRFKHVGPLSFSVPGVASEHTTPDGKVVQYSSPGHRIVYNPITLSRDLTADNALLDWAKTTHEEGGTERKTGSIVLYNRANEEVGRWNFEGAWLMDWSTSGFNANDDTFVMETVTISVDRIYREGAAAS